MDSPWWLGAPKWARTSRYHFLHVPIRFFLVYGARLLLIISGVMLSHLYKSTLWWAYLGAPDVFLAS